MGIRTAWRTEQELWAKSPENKINEGTFTISFRFRNTTGHKLTQCVQVLPPSNPHEHLLNNRIIGGDQMSTELCQGSSSHTVTTVQYKGRDEILSLVLGGLPFLGSSANTNCFAFIFFQQNRNAEALRKQFAHMNTTDQEKPRGPLHKQVCCNIFQTDHAGVI